MRNSYLYTIQDKTAESYAPCYEAPNLKTALRQFTQSIRNIPADTIGDLELICLGKVMREENCSIDTNCPEVGLVDTKKHKELIINTQKLQEK